MLTPEEVTKYKNCLFLESVAPTKIEWTDDLKGQTDFIRNHAEGKLRFYSEDFYMSNRARTTAIYAIAYEDYSKRFNFRNKKYKNAAKKRQELEAKMTQQEEVVVRY